MKEESAHRPSEPPGLAEVSPTDTVEAIGRQSAAFQSILESMQDGVFVVDSRWRCTYVNRAGAAMFHTSADEIVGRSVWEVFPEGCHARVRTEFARTMERKESVRFEDFCRPLGRWYECRCYPAGDGLTVLFTDTTARRQAEKARQAAERRYRQLFEANLAGAYITKLDGTIVDLNQAMIAMLGYDRREELLSLRASQLYVDPDFRLELMRLLKENGIVSGREARLRRKDGTVFEALGAAVLLTDEETGEPFIQGVALDITERKRVEEALRESEQRLRLALESGRMATWEWDVLNHSHTLSERAHDILGLEPAVVNGWALSDCVHPEDQDALRVFMQETLARRADFQTEFRVLRPDGSVAWLALQGKVLRDEQGRAVRVMGILYDATQQKLLEGELRELNDRLEAQVAERTSELTHTVDRLQDEVARRVLAEGRLRQGAQMLEGFFQHTIAPLAFMDGQFNFVRVNEAFAQAAGREPDYFVGRNYFAVFPEDENREIFERVVRTKEPYRAHAKPFHYANGSGERLTWWNWQLTPLLDEQGEVQFLVSNLENVTEQQKAFQTLEKRARQLQELTIEVSQAEDRERKRLAEILHDDLQQLLAAAKFHVSLLGGHTEDEPETHEMALQVKRLLAQAIDQSRSLSHELNPPVLSQSDLCETLTWLAEQMQTKHGLAVRVEACDPVELHSDPIKAFLYKAVQEALFNVIKHAGVREATVRLRHVRGCVSVAVSDTGAGFDAKSLAGRVGFGLLSIRERLKLLGGRATIRSAPGRGSKLLITMPNPQGHGLPPGAAGEPADAPSPPDSADRPLRVLLVDDHKVVRQGLEAVLGQEQDLEIVGQAGDGHEAVELACRLQPDVIVMDVAMPVMPGDEATRDIKQQFPRTRVVALSMFDDRRVADRMQQAGAAAYLLKTAPSEDLLAAIRGRS